MDEIGWIASTARRSNISAIWIGEDIDRGHEVFVQASILMLRAPRQRVGIGITSPLVHNISTIARAAAALKEIDPSRFRLGLGVGGLQDLARLGQTVEKPVAMMESTVNALRRIWAGETVTSQAKHFDLRQYLARYSTGFHVPVYFGVRGPRLIRLACRIADGVILSGPLDYLKTTLNIIRKETAPRLSRSRLRTVVWMPTLVIRKRRDKELAKLVAATVIADTPPSVLSMIQFPKDSVQSIQRRAREQGLVAASEYVTDELLEIFTVSGDASHVSRTLHSLSKLGADEVVFGPPYGTPASSATREVIKTWERL